MRKLLNIAKVLFIIGIASSCQKDFLNLNPLGSYTEISVWKDPNLIESFVNNIYRNTLGWPFSIVRLSDFVDESQFTPDWQCNDFNKSLITEDDLMGFDESWCSLQSAHYRWSPMYSNIRACNIFFSKIKDTPYDDVAKKNRVIGEVYFLRGYSYHYLTAMYGGVPIITKPYNLTDNFDIARNTYAECIDYIVGQLDSAIMFLPQTYDAINLGRVTKGAAMAFKARVLLYAASDLHTNMADYDHGFSNPELLGYTSGSQTDRWQKAYDAAKAVIDSAWYSLYMPDPGSSDSVADNIAQYFTSYGYESEDILLQYFTSKTDEDWSGYNPAEYCGPNGYHNWGNNVPLGELVDDYEMKDGSAFDWTDPAMKASPYTNRDARFYASILYEGVQWRTRPTDVQSIDPWNKLQVGHVYYLNTDSVLVHGVDTRNGPIEDWNGGRSGYYVRKFIDVTKDPQYVKQDIPFRHIRYAEVLLNCAEACIELGKEAEAKTYINMIRHRAGQPDITETGTALRDRYRHERRIELAYEDHRFWDVRRWVIGTEVYHQVHRVDVRYETTAASNYRKADGSTWSAPIFSNQELGGDARAWDDKAYFFPIYRDELNKNTLLVQNPGYN